MKICHCTLGTTNPEVCKTCGIEEGAYTTIGSWSDFEKEIKTYDPIDTLVRNGDQITVSNKSKKSSLSGERRRRKISSLGTITLGRRFAGKTAFVTENPDGTFTVEISL